MSEPGKGTVNPKFGPLLRSTREWKGISQNQLAKDCELNHSYVNRLENGSRMPSRDTTTRILRALGLTEFDDRGMSILDAAGFHIPGSYTKFASAELFELNEIYSGADYETQKEINLHVKFIADAIRNRRYVSA